jgi:thiol-disulfide isomerase/thioredoxin
MTHQHWRTRLRARWRALVRFEAIAWIALAGFLGYRIWPQVAAAFGIDSTSAPAPGFAVRTLAGDSLSSGALRGKVVLLNFWATWCPPCRVEMPGFQRVYDRKKGDGFVVLGISTDAMGRESVARFLVERNITYPVAMATGPIVREFGDSRVLPTSFLIDREGRVRHEVRGIFAAVALEQAVDRLLAETPTDSAAATPKGAGDE